MNVILIFNKFTDAYLGLTYAGDGMSVTPETCNQEHFKYKVVDLDPDTEVWEGNYHTGKVVKRANRKIIITEDELNIDCQTKVFRKYRYYQQFNILYDVIDALIAASNVDESQLTKYREMREYLTRIRDNNDRYKAAYQAVDGYEYWDKAREREELNKQLEGGLHEMIGRDNNTHGLI
ncbi:hypothetical protein [Spartinivicinus ruber]|uniref:hypothetical protein n=1 Tax=Spartinivicinus ruber TaxID=2683272 RepID=UPI0013D69791|nr:hypothetical protein [Spartinivicinus ruber]